MTNNHSISNILSGLYRYSREHDPECPNFLNRRNVAFKELDGAIDVRYRELRQAGVGAVVRHAPVVYFPAEHGPNSWMHWSQFICTIRRLQLSV